MKALKILTSALLMISVLSSSTVPAFASQELAETPPQLETDQVIIQYKSEEAVTTSGVESFQTLEVEEDQPLVTAKVPEGETVEEFIEELKQDPNVLSVEPDHLLSTQNSNDPYIDQYQQHHSIIRSQEAWKRTKGSADVKVAVIDNGFDLNHMDLVDRIEANFHTTTEFSTDVHGTHVAGIVAATNNNGIFGSGVAPGVSLIVIDVFETEDAYTSDVIEGIYYAADYGVDVINLSLGNYVYNEEFNTAIQYAHSKGAVIIAAAGNDSTSVPMYPASFENVISVGSTDGWSQDLSYFSNYGSTIDLVAPGSSIWSTIPDYGFEQRSGTSMAAPMVAGVAALIKSNDEALSNVEIEEKLVASAEDFGNTGYDERFGNGQINAAKALDVVNIEAPIVNPVNEFSKVVKGYWGRMFDKPATIYVTDGTNVLATYPNYYGLTFEVPIEQPIGIKKLYVYLVDGYSNKSQEAYLSVLDVTPPPSPTVDEIGDSSTRVTGKTESYSVVIVKKNGVEIGRSSMSYYEAFYVKIPVQKAGTELSVTAIDQQGKESLPTVIVVKDNTPPEVTIEEVTDKSTQITGTTEPNTSIKAYSRSNSTDQLIGEGQSLDDGSFIIKIPKQLSGTMLRLDYQDQHGNQGSYSTEVLDVTPPDLIIVGDIDNVQKTVNGMTDIGSLIKVYKDTELLIETTNQSKKEFSIYLKSILAGDILTIVSYDDAGNKSPEVKVTVKDKTPPDFSMEDVTDQSTEIKGITESEVTISVFSQIDGKSSLVGEGKSNEAGEFSIAISKLKKGTHLHIEYVDRHGNMGMYPSMVSGTEPPELTLTSDIDDLMRTISGRTDTFSTIQFFRGTELIGSTTTNFNDNEFSQYLIDVVAGEELTIIATDQWGNKTSGEKVIVLDRTAPKIISYEDITNFTEIVKLKTEPNVLVKVFKNNILIGQGTSDRDGLVHISITKQEPHTNLKITVTDNAGNVSGIERIEVLDVTPLSAPTVNPVNRFDDFVSGTVTLHGAYETDIIVSNSNKELGRITVGGTQSFSIAIPRQEIGTELFIYVMDARGFISDKTSVIVDDAEPPSKPIINEFSDAEEFLTGIAVPGTELVVLDKSGEINRINVEQDGRFTVYVGRRKAGDTLEAYSVKYYELESERIEIVVLDRTPPEIYSVDSITDQSTEISGITEPSATVEIHSDSELIGSTKANHIGHFTVSIPVQPALSDLIIVPIDQAGNRSEFYQVRVEDITPPKKPILEEFSDVSAYLNGEGEMFGKVEVYKGIEKIGTQQLWNSRQFSIFVGLQSAGTELLVYAYDSSMNRSDPTVLTVKDLTSPSYINVLPVYTDTTLIEGYSEASAKIEIYYDQVLVGSTIALVDGSFSIPVPKPRFTTRIEVHASDLYQNTRMEIVQVDDLHPPMLNEISEITDQSTFIEGVTESFSTISVTIVDGDQLLGETKADKDGKFKLSIPKLQAGTRLYLTIIDEAQRRSGGDYLEVIDKTPPLVPTIDKVKTNSTAISGTAEPASKIYIIINGVYYTFAFASAEGTYSIPIENQVMGTLIEVYAVDDVDNESERVSTIVEETIILPLTLEAKVSYYTTNIRGTTSPGAMVELYYSDGEVMAHSYANQNGAFVIDYHFMEKGKWFYLQATDDLGNQSVPYHFLVDEVIYPDLKSNHWAYGQIMYLVGSGIIGGYPDGTFQPNRQTTRAEAARMLASALNLEVIDTPSIFKDVASSHWANDYIVAVAKAGIFTGNPDGTFNPSGKLTRAEMAVLLSKAYELKAMKPAHFTDVKAGHWANTSIAAMFENNITVGYPDGTYRPSNPTTRAEFSMFLAKALNPDFR